MAAIASRGTSRQYSFRPLQLGTLHTAFLPALPHASIQIRYKEYVLLLLYLLVAADCARGLLCFCCCFCCCCCRSRQPLSVDGKNKPSPSPSPSPTPSPKPSPSLSPAPPHTKPGKGKHGHGKRRPADAAALKHPFKIQSAQSTMYEEDEECYSVGLRDLCPSDTQVRVCTVRLPAWQHEVGITAQLCTVFYKE
jgi:hypothetical protein